MNRVGASRLARLLLAFLATGAISATHGGSHPNSMTQPEQDGCERSPIDLISTALTPQWVFVNNDPAPKYVRGRVVRSRPTYTDNFRQHDSYDMNWDLRPDSGYESFLSTANLAAGEEGEETAGTLHNEWEQRAYPLFAWPTVGDDVEMLGSWIWDCAHWSDPDFTDPQESALFLAPGTQPGEEITGEKTEFHPPRMVVAHRETPSKATRGEATTDVFISSDGTLAYAIEDWAAGGCDQPNADNCPQWQPVNDRDYSFDVAAPTKPAGARTLTVKVVDRGSRNAPDPVITRRPEGIQVRVPFKGWGTDGERMVFAKTFLVGWDVGTPMHHYRVRMRSLEWLVELDGPGTFFCAEEPPCAEQGQFSSPPDEVNVYVDVAGQWSQLTPEGLLEAAPGDRFPLDATFDVYLRSGDPLRIYARGRECEQIGLRECPTPTEEGFNNDAGEFADVYTAGATGLAGTHTEVARSEHCEEVAGTPCFRLTYAIEDLGLVGGRSETAGDPNPKGPVLPATGPSPWWAVALAGVLSVAGASVLALRRRRRRASSGAA